MPKAIIMLTLILIVFDDWGKSYKKGGLSIKSINRFFLTVFYISIFVYNPLFVLLFIYLPMVLFICWNLRSIVEYINYVQEINKD